MARKTPPEANPSLRHFGRELTRLRTIADMSQRDLAKACHVSPSLIGAIERAERSPSRRFAAQANELLNGGGALVNLWPNLVKDAYPEWVGTLIEAEGQASMIREYQPLLFPGLLQTEDYARVTFKAGNPHATPPEVQRLVSARMERQYLLHDSDLPVMWVILDETVIRRIVGSARVMHEQLGRLLTLNTVERITVQIIPFAVRHHPGLSGPFTVLSFSGRPDLVYVEGVGSGSMVSQASEVEKISLAYGSLQSAALSPEQSAELIETVRDELNGPEVAQVQL